MKVGGNKGNKGGNLWGFVAPFYVNSYSQLHTVTQNHT